jgi:hypothetical protein
MKASPKSPFQTGHRPDIWKAPVGFFRFLSLDRLQSYCTCGCRLVEYSGAVLDRSGLEVRFVHTVGQYHRYPASGTILCGQSSFYWHRLWYPRRRPLFVHQQEPSRNGFLVGHCSISGYPPSSIGETHSTTTQEKNGSFRKAKRVGHCYSSCLDRLTGVAEKPGISPFAGGVHLRHSEGVPMGVYQCNHRCDHQGERYETERSQGCTAQETNR